MRRLLFLSRLELIWPVSGLKISGFLENQDRRSRIEDRGLGIRDQGSSEKKIIKI